VEVLKDSLTLSNNNSRLSLTYRPNSNTLILITSQEETHALVMVSNLLIRELLLSDVLTLTIDIDD
jgi:hypothetical protein